MHAIQQFLLNQDLIEARNWQLWAQTPTGYQRLLEENGTNPKIRKLAIAEIDRLVNIYESTAEYAVRLVKSANLNLLIKGQNKYFLSFDGVNGLPYKAFLINESYTQELYWTIYLQRLSDIFVTINPGGSAPPPALTLQNRSFLLTEDLIENRPWQLWTETAPNVFQRIVQSNSTNPKIRKLKEKDKARLTNFFEILPTYSCRLIKHTNLNAIVNGQKFYFVSFDGGTSGKKYYVSFIQESKQNDLYWTIYLTETNETIYQLATTFTQIALWLKSRTIKLDPISILTATNFQTSGSNSKIILNGIFDTASDQIQLGSVRSLATLNGFSDTIETILVDLFNLASRQVKLNGFSVSADGTISAFIVSRRINLNSYTETANVINLVDLRPRSIKLESFNLTSDSNVNAGVFFVPIKLNGFGITANSAADTALLARRILLQGYSDTTELLALDNLNLISRQINLSGFSLAADGTIQNSLVSRSTNLSGFAIAANGSVQTNLSFRQINLSGFNVAVDSAVQTNLTFRQINLSGFNVAVDSVVQVNLSSRQINLNGFGIAVDSSIQTNLTSRQINLGGFSLAADGTIQNSLVSRSTNLSGFAIAANSIVASNLGSRSTTLTGYSDSSSPASGGSILPVIVAPFV